MNSQNDCFRRCTTHGGRYPVSECYDCRNPPAMHLLRHTIPGTVACGRGFVNSRLPKHNTADPKEVTCLKCRKTVYYKTKMREIYPSLSLDTIRSIAGARIAAKTGSANRTERAVIELADFVERTSQVKTL
jgi:hypothetical protein